jgi:ribonuclease P protein component
MIPSVHKFTLRKAEILREKKLLDELFLKGKAISVPGIRLLWKFEKSNADETQERLISAKVAFSVPKRNFKSAVKRNLLKRRMREAYRKNKPFPPYNTKVGNPDETVADNCYLLFIYTEKTIFSYPEIESKIIVSLQRLKLAIK